MSAMSLRAAAATQHDLDRGEDRATRVLALEGPTACAADGGHLKQEAQAGPDRSQAHHSRDRWAIERG